MVVHDRSQPWAYGDVFFDPAPFLLCVCVLLLCGCVFLLCVCVFLLCVCVFLLLMLLLLLVLGGIHISNHDYLAPF